MIPQFSDPGSQFGVIGDDGPSIAETAQVLLNDEAGTDSIAEFADGEVVATRPERLRAVLDEPEVPGSRNLCHGAHVRRLPIQVDWDDCLSLGRYGRFNQRRVDVAGLRIDVHKYGRGADQPNGFCGSKERIRSGYHFIAG